MWILNYHSLYSLIKLNHQSCLIWMISSVYIENHHEESIVLLIYIKLLDFPSKGYSMSQHDSNGGCFYNRLKSVIKVIYLQLLKIFCCHSCFLSWLKSHMEQWVPALNNDANKEMPTVYYFMSTLLTEMTIQLVCHSLIWFASSISKAFHSPATSTFPTSLPIGTSLCIEIHSLEKWL